MPYITTEQRSVAPNVVEAPMMMGGDVLEVSDAAITFAEDFGLDPNEVSKDKEFCIFVMEGDLDVSYSPYMDWTGMQGSERTYMTFIYKIHPDGSASTTADHFTVSKLHELMDKAYKITYEVNPEYNISAGANSATSGTVMMGTDSSSDSYIGKIIGLRTPAGVRACIIAMEVTGAESPNREYLCFYGEPERVFKPIVVFSEIELDMLIAMSEGKIAYKEITGKSLYIDKTSDPLVGQSFKANLKGTTYTYKVDLLMGVENSPVKLYFVSHNNWGVGGGSAGFNFYTESQLTDLMSKAI